MTSPSQISYRRYLPFRGVKNDDTVFLPLDPVSWEIRCAILHPGSGDDPITCELVHTDIKERSDTSVPYVALSYVWGDEEDTVEIILKGSSTNSLGARQESISTALRITRNLYVALLTLRRNESKQCLWIDALCINQQDPQEKTHQVQLMGKIYSSAESVLVWLGPENGYSKFFLRAWMKHLYPLVNGHNGIWILYDVIVKRTHPLWTDVVQDPVLRQLALDLNDEQVDEVPPDFYKKALWTSFDDLFRRSWWSRIWVIQEVLLAPKREDGSRKVEFRIGDGKLHWQEMLQIHKSLNNYLNIMPNNVRPATDCRCDVARNSWQFFFLWDDTNLNISFEMLLDSTRNFKASDARDKVFALLLLGSDTRNCFWQEPLICPDYTKSVDRVLFDMMCWSQRCGWSLHNMDLALSLL